MGKCACGRTFHGGGSQCRQCRRDERWEDEFANTDWDAHEDDEDDEEVSGLLTDGSGHVCNDCGETFETLSALRIHEKDECQNRATYAELNPDADDIGLQAAGELVTCRNCGRENGSADFEDTTSFDGDDFHYITEFTCVFCGFENENRVVMTGVDRDDLDRLPPHLQPDDQEIATDGGVEEIPIEDLPHNEPAPESVVNPYHIGDPVVDCAQGRPMVVIDAPDESVAAWSERNDYDLTENYANSKFGCHDGEAVVECVYVSDVRSEPSKTYTFPVSRVRLIDVHHADGGLRVYERVAREVLESVFESMARYEALDSSDIRAVADHLGGFDPALVDEARELADVDTRLGGDGE